MLDIVVGIDVGTTSVKALAVDLSGRILAETALPTPWEHRGAEAQIDPRLLADTVRQVLIALAQHENWPSGGRARGIGVAGMAETGILLDPSGSPVAPALAWHDPRGRADLIEREVGRSEFHRHVGMRLNSKPSVAKILWLQENIDHAATATRHLSVGEWIVRDLGGEQVAELSLLSRTGLYDVVAQECWSPTLSLTGPLVPDRIVVAGEHCGVVDDSLPEPLRGAVLTVAGMDHQAAALSNGAARAGVLFDSMGTAEALLRFVPGPMNPDDIEKLVDQDVAVMWSVVPGLVCVLDGFLTGLSLQRLLGALGRTELSSRKELAAQALSAQRGAISINAIELTGLSISGIDDEATPGAIWRAAVEDVTSVSARAVTFVESLVGPRTGTVIAGGWIHDAMIRDARLRQLGDFKISEVAEAGAMGAAYLGAIAAGLVERPGVDVAPQWPDA